MPFLCRQFTNCTHTHGLHTRRVRCRCDTDRLLDESNMGFLGNQSTACEWSADSQAAVVFYDEAHDPLVAGMNITLAGG